MKPPPMQKLCVYCGNLFKFFAFLSLLPMILFERNRETIYFLSKWIRGAYLIKFNKGVS